MSQVIIICGLPGAGKTTLAQALSKELNMACLHKDVLKESLYTLLKMNTFEDSLKSGQISISLLLELADRMVRNNIDIMLEAPFLFEEDYTIFQKWIDEHRANLVHIICSISDEERIKRFTTRLRHAAHHDQERDVSQSSEEREKVYEKLPGRIIRIETNKEVNKLIEEIIGQL